MPPFRLMLRPGYGIGPGNLRPKDFLMTSAYQIPNTRTAIAGGGAQGTAQVLNGAMMMCSCGTHPASLLVLPPNRAANIYDAIPHVNITPSGMCITMANPLVAAATAAALGVLTPQICIPLTNVWSYATNSGLVNGSPALTPSSTCLCHWGGVITIIWPGQ
jgi:hypothetical protein